GGCRTARGLDLVLRLAPGLFRLDSARNRVGTGRRRRPRPRARPLPSSLICAPNPQEEIMWVRQCDLDAQAEAPPPIPSRIASNRKSLPPPQSAEQKAFEARLTEISERAARRQGLSRRDFLRTGSGMAAALLAMNDLFGDCYEVSAEEALDQ